MFLLLWQFSITGDSEGAWPKGGPEVTGRSDTQSVSEGRPRGGGGGRREGETREAGVGNTVAVNATRTACGKLLVAFKMISSSYR